MRPGSVVVDVAIDQGVYHHRATHHAQRANLRRARRRPLLCHEHAGAVPRTSTIGLSNATLPYGLALADFGLLGAISRDPELARGVNVINGKVTHPGVAEALGLEYAAPGRDYGPGRSPQQLRSRSRRCRLRRGWGRRKRCNRMSSVSCKCWRLNEGSRSIRSSRTGMI